ncbi:MAG: hypothetical protein EGP82_10170 [Odoribacter splanchnicus]|nr:hypothetical protein [Odoribacter splanchnicus]
MIEFKNIEFSLSPSGKIQYSVEGGTKIYDVNDYEFTTVAIDWIKKNYPDAIKILENKFSDNKHNRPYRDWRIVTKFFACKCGACDNITDIDEDGNLHSEFMSCPNRVFCEDKICQIKPIYKLTETEKNVVSLLSDGLSIKSIALLLNKTPDAVKGTVTRACKRFGISINGKKLVAFCDKKELL